MPFMVPALAAIGGGSAVAGGLTLASTAASAAGALKQASAAKKAASAAGNASQVDIDALDAKVREISRKNALESAELERQLTPEVPILRRAATAGVTSNLGDSLETTAARDILLSQLGQPVAGRAMSPLLMAAIQKAKADLDLGGGLDTATKNLVTRRALAKSGSVSGNLGLGRDLSARDLGLTSLDLQQQRLTNAAQLGAQEQGAEEFNVKTRFNNAANLLNQIQLLRAIGDSRFGRNLAAAQFGQSIAPPVVGMDPGSVADAVTGNATNRSSALANQANLAGQQSQNLFGLSGQLLSYGLNKKAS